VIRTELAPFGIVAVTGVVELALVSVWWPMHW